MLYVPVDVSLREHPKLDHLVEMSGRASHAECAGWVTMLWLWAMQQEVPYDGTLPPMSRVSWQRATGCKLDEADQVRSWLEASGFVDSNNGKPKIHDWHKHGGKVMEARDRKAAAMREKRGVTVAEQCSDVPATLLPRTEQSRAEDNRGEEMESEQETSSAESAEPPPPPPFIPEPEPKLPIVVPDELKDLPRFIACSRLVCEWQTIKHEWSMTYPGVDLMAELRKAHAWQNANPKKAKTPKGQMAFLVNWLSRAQDSPRRGSPSSPAPAGAMPLSSYNTPDRQAENNAMLEARRARRAV